MPWRKERLPGTLKKKHKSVIITELKNTWPEITENQKLGQDRKRNNRHKENFESKF